MQHAKTVHLVMWNEHGEKWWKDAACPVTKDQAFYDLFDLLWWLVGSLYLIPHRGQVYYAERVHGEMNYVCVGNLATGTIGCPE